MINRLWILRPRDPCQIQAESLAQWTGCSPCTQEVEGLTPTRGTCPNDFSDPIDQDICTQWALSWKIVVSEWRSVIAVSLNVGGGVRLIKPAKLCMCMQNTTNTTRTDAGHQVCAANVPYCWTTRATSLRELEYTHTLPVRFINYLQVCTAFVECKHLILLHQNY